METIFINKKDSIMNEPHRFFCNVSLKLDWKSSNLKKEIRKILHVLYPRNKITKEVYNNLIKSV